VLLTGLVPWMAHLSTLPVENREEPIDFVSLALEGTNAVKDLVDALALRY
jgi:hypothetical protein